MIAGRRATNKRDANTSCIEELFSSTGELLNELVAKTDHVEVVERCESEKLLQIEADPNTNGKQIRHSDLITHQYVKDYGREDTGNTSSRRQTMNSSNDWYEVLEREDLRRREAKEGELQLSLEEL